MSSGRRGGVVRARAAVGGRLRSLARRLRHLPDRLLHRRRHREARRRLIDRTRGRIGEDAFPRRVVFVCWGNICRSPYAEHVFRARLPAVLRERVRVESAGFFGLDRPSPERALEVAAGRGVDLSGHASRLVTPGLAAGEGDLVFVMEPDQIRRLRQTAPATRATVLVLGDLDPLPVRRRAIPDPYGHPPGFFEEVYERIDRALEVAIEALEEGVAVGGGRGETPGPDHPVGSDLEEGAEEKVGPERPVGPEKPGRSGE